tara:strand:+ start:1190 stop:1333 length:144 start_codon:yes stop_codon:yes gene_type:complete
MIVDLKEEIDKRKLTIKKKNILKILNGTDKPPKKTPLSKIFYTKKSK